MGMFGGLNAEAYDRSYSDRVLIARIWRYFSAFRRRMIILSFVTIAMAAFGALLPILVSNGVQALVQTSTDLYLIGLVLVVLLVGVSNWAAN